MAEETEKDVQTKHVLEVAQANLAVVIDQLGTLDSAIVKKALTALNNAKKELDQQLNDR